VIFCHNGPRIWVIGLFEDLGFLKPQQTTTQSQHRDLYDFRM
jgi:hypothetical protein